MCVVGRIDGALDPWLEKLTVDLLHAFPLPPTLEVLPDGKPVPRVAIIDSGTEASKSTLSTTDGYFISTVTRNERITAKDWYQDVRHFDFDFDQDIRHVQSGSMFASICQA